MSTNLNRNAYFALKLKEEGYVSVNPVEGLSLCGGKTFTLSVQFYPKAVTGKKSLFRQDGTFELGINDDLAYFQAEGLGMHQLNNDDSLNIIPNCWNTICVTYDKSKLRIYVNGLMCYEASATAPGKTTMDDYVLGGTFEGYIQYVRMYHECKSDKEVAADQIKEKDKIGQTALYLDFSRKVPEELNGRQIVCHGNDEEKTALKVQDDGKVIPANSRQVNSLIGTSSFTILARLYLPSEIELAANQLYHIFSNEDYGKAATVQVLHHSNRTPYINVPSSNMGSAASIPYDQWVNVVLSYDKSAGLISWYVNENGYTNYNISINAVSDTNFLIAGKRDWYNTFPGYIDSVSVFDRYMDRNTILSYIQNPPSATSEGIVSFYTFNDGTAIDKKTGQALIVTGNAKIVPFTSKPIVKRCEPINLVRALYGAKGYLEHPDSGDVNPTKFENGFTILSKIYAKPHENDIFTCIYTNGESFNEYGIRMNLCKYGEIDCLVAAVGTSSANSKVLWVPIPYNQWLDVAIAYDKRQQKLYMYLNGECKATYENVVPPKISTKNSTIYNPSGTEPIRGFVDYVAVFDEAVSEERLKGYLDTRPFELDQHMVSFYDFSGETPLELVSEAELTIVGDVSIELCEGTQDVECEPNYYIFPESPEVDDFTRWQASMVLDIYTSFNESVYGLSPDLEKDEKGHYIYPTILITTIVGSFGVLIHRLGGEYQAIPPEAVAEVFKESRDHDSTLTRVFRNLYNGTRDCFRGLTRVAASSAFKKFSLIAGGTVLGIGFGFIINEVAKNSSKDDNPPDPKPDPNKEYRILLLKFIQFYHGDDKVQSGSIRLRNFDGNQIPIPEWKKGDSEPSQLAYISSVLSDTYMTITLEYQTNMDGKVTTKITGKNKGELLFGNMESTIELDPGQKEYVCKIPFDASMIKNLKVGSYYCEINWGAELGSVQFLQTSKHEVHLLAKEPMEPWSINEEDKLPTVDALKICGEIFTKWDKTQSITSDAVAKAVTQWMHRNNRFIYSMDGENKFSSIQHNEMLFNRDDLEHDIITNGESITVGSLDCSLLIADCARLQGFQEINILEITTGRSISYVEPKPDTYILAPDKISHYEVPLDFYNATLIGTDVEIESCSIDAHWIAVNEGEMDQALVYDGTISRHSDSGISIMSGIPFSDLIVDVVMPHNDATYRESIIQSGTPCQWNRYYVSWNIGAISKDIRQGRQQPPPHSSFVPGTIITLNAYPSRPFDASIRTQFRTQPGQAVCHSISYSTFRAAILRTINEWDANPGGVSIATVQQQLQGIFDSVYNGVQRAQLTPPQQIFFDNATNSIQGIITLLNTLPLNQPFLVQLMDDLAYYLNNASPNLRVGNSSWNSSLGGSFDPRSWVYVERDNITGQLVVTQSTNLRNIHDPLSNHFNNGIPLPTNEGFYLLEESDGTAIETLLTETINYDDYDISIYNSVDINGDPFLYSSSNDYPIPTTPSIIPRAASFRIYYLHNNIWKAFG